MVGKQKMGTCTKDMFLGNIYKGINMVWVVSGSFQMWMQMCCLLPPDHLYLQRDRCMLHVLAGSWHCAGNAAPWFLIYSYLRNRSINYTELYMVVFTRSRCRWGGLWAAANPRMMSLINFVGMRLTANYDKVDIKNLWPLWWTCKARMAQTSRLACCWSARRLHAARSKH